MGVLGKNRIELEECLAELEDTLKKAKTHEEIEKFASRVEDIRNEIGSEFPSAGSTDHLDTPIANEGSTSECADLDLKEFYHRSRLQQRVRQISGRIQGKRLKLKGGEHFSFSEQARKKYVEDTGFSESGKDTGSDEIAGSDAKNRKIIVDETADDEKEEKKEIEITNPEILYEERKPTDITLPETGAISLKDLKDQIMSIHVQDDRDVILENLWNCEVSFTGKVAKLSIKNMRYCALKINVAAYAGDENSEKITENIVKAALIFDLHFCCVMISGIQQLRIHDTSNVAFLVDAKTGPIIEECNSVFFGPASLVWKRANSSTVSPDTSRRIVSGSTTIFENRWWDVADFRWLKREVSPNWAPMPSAMYFAGEFVENEFILPSTEHCFAWIIAKKGILSNPKTGLKDTQKIDWDTVYSGNPIKPATDEKSIWNPFKDKQSPPDLPEPLTKMFSTGVLFRNQERGRCMWLAQTQWFGDSVAQWRRRRLVVENKVAAQQVVQEEDDDEL